MQLEKHKVFVQIIELAEGIGMDSTSCVWHMMGAFAVQHFAFVIETHTGIPEPSCVFT